MSVLSYDNFLISSIYIRELATELFEVVHRKKKTKVVWVCLDCFFSVLAIGIALYK